MPFNPISPEDLCKIEDIHNGPIFGPMAIFIYQFKVDYKLVHIFKWQYLNL